MTKPTNTVEKTPKKANRKASDKGQFERFVQTARQIGVDEDPATLDRAFDKAIPTKRRP
jgi:hypothetical protein